VWKSGLAAVSSEPVSRLSESRPLCIGLVVHPRRDIDNELATLKGWSEDRGCRLVQVGEAGRQVAERGGAEDTDLVVSLGGDGTALVGIHQATMAGRPVLAVACGSLGVLTSVTADALAGALDRFAAGEWTRRELPVLAATSDDGERLDAVNDIALLRDGEGQVTTTATIDGVLYARFVGDGFLVSTAAGSSGYTLAAGGPLLGPGTMAFVLTPLSSHGGSVPPVIVAARSELHLQLDKGHAGARLEVDGQTQAASPGSLTVRLQPERVTLVSFEDTPPLFSQLRRRQILMDSPRVLARDRRDEGEG
jgi:NAD+ kinase